MTKLDDLTIVIPVKIEHTDRLYNLIVCLEYLRRNFDVKIIVGECSKTPDLKVICRTYNCMHYWIYDENDKFFHITKIRNILKSISTTKYILSLDCDIIVPENQLVDALELIKNESEKCIVYPYTNYYNINVNNRNVFNSSEKLNFEKLISLEWSFKVENSCGGCVLFKKEDDLLYGGHCEYILSWGSECVEYKTRFEKLGFKIKRIDGNCYHIDHYRGKDSTWDGAFNKYYDSNMNYLEYIKNINKDDLCKEISNYPWKYNSYKKEYKNILVSAVNSNPPDGRNFFFNGIKTQIDMLHSTSYDDYDMQYIYDLGMTKDERNYLNSISKVIVLDFPEEHKNIYDEFLLYRYYGFKISAINDVSKYGENIFWLDSGITVLKNIKHIFEEIDNNHIFLVEDDDCYNNTYTSDLCFQIMGSDKKEIYGHQLSAGILGYKHLGNYQYFMDESFSYARLKYCLVGSSDEHRHDQSIYSNLKEKYGIKVHPMKIYGEFKGILSDDQVLYVHRGTFCSEHKNIRYK